MFDTDVSISKLWPVRRVAWSGQIPANEVDARRRIMDAAVRCVQQHGIDRTSVAMIASEAGVSRPTLYAYFENRDEIVNQAAIAASDSFVERVIAHSRQFHSAAERLVEATLFSVRGIRAEPALAIRFRRGQLLSGPLNRDELFYAALCLGPVVELAPELAAWIDEASELAARVIISLVSREPIEERTDDEERAFLYRWWPQALGLAGATASGSGPRPRPVRRRQTSSAR
jgi:AcrR family transcriptional regulator